jgi:hypothetical protein
MMSGPTKAQLVASYEKQLEAVSTENKDLRLEIQGLKEQVQRLKDALIHGEDLALQRMAEADPGDALGRWRRLKCWLGWHEPHPRDFQKRMPRCEHCERFYER